MPLAKRMDAPPALRHSEAAWEADSRDAVTDSRIDPQPRPVAGERHLAPTPNQSGPSARWSACTLFDKAYVRLKSLASRELTRSGAHTINTTALVHELYLKICAHGDREFAGPPQFYVYAARAMRHILVDRARYRICLKSGGRDVHVPLTDPTFETVAVSPELALHLDAALRALEQDAARAALVVELHYFAGLSLERVAEILGIVRRTADRDWRYARAFLLAQVT